MFYLCCFRCIIVMGSRVLFMLFLLYNSHRVLCFINVVFAV